MKLNEASQQPLYHQLKQMIKEEINRGTYDSGQKLPPEATLCELYGVSRITARRAISDLVEEGVLQRQQGKGTYVKGFKLKSQLVSVGGFSEITSAEGKKPRTQILSTVTVEAGELGAKFQVEEKTKLLKLHRLLFVDEEPFIIETSYYPLNLLSGLEMRINTSSSTYSILKDVYNVHIKSSEKTVDLVYSTVYESNLFQCDIGTPLFSVEKLASDKQSRTVHVSQSLFLTTKVTFMINADQKKARKS